MRLIPCLLLILLLPIPVATGDDTTHTDRFPARDTLERPESAPTPDLYWPAAAFEVIATAGPGIGADALVTFPSPRAEGDPRQDTVALEWHAARDAAGRAVAAPAALIVHSLHPDMPVARFLARSLAQRGIHAFVIHMPGYGRRTESGRAAGVTALVRGSQAIADIRRARDAILALPNIRGGRVALAGISLGGFAAATAAGLDDAFGPVTLALSGGGGYDVLQHGAYDAAALNRELALSGYAGESLRKLLDPIEPLRVAASLDPAQTWLFTAAADRVVPVENALRLARAIGLAEDHHVWLPGGHYTAAFALPVIARRIADIILGEGGEPAP